MTIIITTTYSSIFYRPTELYAFFPQIRETFRQEKDRIQNEEERARKEAQEGD
jgi:hypothetical protein